jgi:hypothetical protein
MHHDGPIEFALCTSVHDKTTTNTARTQQNQHCAALTQPFAALTAFHTLH